MRIEGRDIVLEDEDVQELYDWLITSSRIWRGVMTCVRKLDSDQVPLLGRQIVFPRPGLTVCQMPIRFFSSYKD